MPQGVPALKMFSVGSALADAVSGTLRAKVGPNMRPPRDASAKADPTICPAKTQSAGRARPTWNSILRRCGGHFKLYSRRIQSDNHSGANMIRFSCRCGHEFEMPEDT